MFTKLDVQNYRAIGPKPLNLDLAPITIFVGKSGVGKSCILEALALTAQSVTEDPTRSDLILDGTRLKLPETPGEDYRERFRRLYFREDAETALSIGFSWRIPDGASTEVVSDSAQGKLRIDSLLDENGELSYRWSRTGLTFDAFSHEFATDGSDFLKVWSEYTRKSRNSAAHSTQAIIWNKDPVVAPWIRSPNRLLSDELLEVVRERSQQEATNLDDSISVAVDNLFSRPNRDLLEFILEQLRKALGGVQMLSALRGTQLMHTDAGPKVQFVGVHAENTIRLLASLQAKTSNQFDRLSVWAERFGLPKFVAALDGNLLKSLFVDPVSGTPLQLWQAATGSRQGLTVAAQLLLSPPGSTLLLEEPEANLHPGYELLLPELFADALAGGRQVLATTHSEILVAALGNAVRKKLLNPKQVLIWHIDRDEEGVKAERLEIDDKGYMQDWVRSFAAVEEELFDEWYNTLPPAE